MTDYPQALADLLASVQRPGGFHVAGSFDIHPPRLEVEGVGSIALPLLPAQAEALVAGAEQAPYGRGSETLVDTGVRRTWQVDAARVKLTGRKWAEDLAGVVERVRVGLAVAGAIEAQLYKLLIYDTGSFFVSHRDTEKAPGMFATLVVVLPCDYSGGELIIRHRGEEARVDLHRDEPSEAAFAAFYADCRHEVLPIASGYRLALIYNLIRRGEGPLPQAPDYGSQQAALTRLLADWDRSGAAPDKLVYPLEHAYTEAEIGFPALKGQDAAAAQVLISAAAAAGCDLYLALISVAETGWADYTGGGLRVSIPALLEGVRRWEAAGAMVGDGDWRGAHRLAGAIRAQWPQEVWVRNHASTEGRSRGLLEALIRLGDLEGGAEFTAALVAGGAYSLEARIALPLEPPADWARPVAIGCKCAHCRALSGFLASPEEPVWHFKANEAERRHVTAAIQGARCDLDLATNKRGRPYTLVCTKNQASFHRRVKQREQDLRHREQLAP